MRCNLYNWVGILMADFDKAIALVLKHEGGYVHDKDDPGGATKYGMSARFLNSIEDLIKDDIDSNGNNVIDSDDINRLNVDTAEKLYKAFWWDKYRYGEIENDSLATKIFDISVNIGPHQAHTDLQRSFNVISRVSLLKVDGIFGSKTLAAINTENPRYLLIKFKGLIANYYRSLARDHDKLSKYLQGWLNRLNDH